MAGITKKEQKNRKISKAMDKLTPDAIRKLEEVFSLDASTNEIAFYLDVSVQTLYNWRKREPKLFERLDRLKEKPVLKARNTILRNLDDPQHAKWYMEKKAKGFTQKQEIEHSGQVTQMHDASDDLKNIAQRYEEEIKGKLKE